MIYYSGFRAVYPVGAGMASQVAAVTSAIAYARGMETSRITVSYEDGVLFLDGAAADRNAMEKALSIANGVATCPVRTRLDIGFGQRSTKAVEPS